MRYPPFLARLALFVAGPLAVVGVSAGIALKHSIPETSGAIAVPGVERPVRIVRDEWGVPDIRAATDHDAFFALGYAHAQDRMWQMDYKRRLGQGRLSEMLGARFLTSDKLMRTLGLRQAAQGALAALSPAERASLRAYAEGVNAWIAGDHSLPVEYRYFGLRPEPWREDDSLLMVKLLALSLGGNYRQELVNQVLVKHLGVERASELTGTAFAASAPASVDADAATAALWRLSGTVERSAGLAGEGVGSNGWAVSGRHAEGGKPLLAGDPHLRTQLPSTFYLARLRGDRLDVAGATLPGVPVVVFGHNANIAWTGTNLAADAQDLYVERVSIDKEQYEADGQWREIGVREEWIRVAPEFPAFLREPYRPIRWLARSTRNGPLISDAAGGDGQTLSLRWSALDANDRSYASMLAINYAGGLDGFRAALRDYAAPALTFVYADKADNIALLPAGRIPVRQTSDGLLPVPGWDGTHRWLRYLEADELPATINPASGRVVSANQRIHGDDYPWLLSNSWQPAYRAKRIDALLATRMREGRALAVADFAAIQGDVLDPQAGEALPILFSAKHGNEAQREAIERLRAWDRRMASDSVGAALYHAWSRHFVLRLTNDALQVDLVHGERLEILKDQAETFRPELLRRIARGELRHWCGAGADACERQALLALDDASAELRRLAGADPDGWTWEAVHQTHLPHAPFTHSAFLGRVFDRRTPAGGGRYTVDVSAGGFDKERGYVGELSAAYRQIVPLADPSRSRFMIDSGQSGNIADTHYADLMRPHREGRGLLLGGRAGDALVLRPLAELGQKVRR